MSHPAKVIETRVVGIAVEPGTTPASAIFRIEIAKDGSYLVYGQPPLAQKFITPDASGVSWTFCEAQSFGLAGLTALCRCGHLANKPFCDGSHATLKWQDSLPMQAGAIEF
ncbi:MAG: CDGSH iron-sulfur domain-containing protein [Burkholderiaceae bacterium]